MKIYFFAFFIFCSESVLADDTFIYCSEASPSSFNPQLASDGATFNVTRALYDGLMGFEIGGVKVVPALAKSWKVSSDGKTITFYLRDDVSFHSAHGFTPTRKFNSDDVIFSFDRMRDAAHPFHKVGGGRYKYFTSMEMHKIIDRIEKVDEHVVRIYLSRPEASIIANLAMDFANILSKEYGDYLLKLGRPENIDTAPIGTGPYRFIQYSKDKFIQFEANPQYFGGKAKIKNLQFQIIESSDMRVEKLKKGECHLISSAPPSRVEEIRAVNKLRIMGQPGLNIFYLAMNTTQKPFNDVRVRQAINHAIHREKIIQEVFGGQAQVAKNPIPPTMWGYNRQIIDYDYNPNKAKMLLAEAGLADGFDFKLWYMSAARPYNPNGRRIAEMMVEDLKKIGVRAELRTKDWTSYLKSAADGQLEVLQAGWTGDNGDPDNFLNLLLACTSVKGGSNYARWCNSEYSHLVGRARVTTDIRKRTQFYEQAQVIFKKEAPWVTLAHVTVYKAMSKKVKGYKISPFGHDDFRSVEWNGVEE